MAVPQSTPWPGVMRGAGFAPPARSQDGSRGFSSSSWGEFVWKEDGADGVRADGAVGPQNEAVRRQSDAQSWGHPKGQQ